MDAEEKGIDLGSLFVDQNYDGLEDEQTKLGTKFRHEHLSKLRNLQIGGSKNF